MGITPKNPADFDPTMGDYKDLKPFRFWCQKVLPLVYDDSLSYYEVLCKVVDYLNKAMEDIGVLHDDVDALHTAYQQLQSYVNDYFSTLDVQEEINHKLDVMAEDGTLDALLLPYFNAYKDEINGIIANQNQNISNFEDSVNGVLNTQNNNITVLQNRMDGFANLPEGSTSADAELLDIRNGADGFTYSTAGVAVRTQFTNTNNTVDAILNNQDHLYYKGTPNGTRWVEVRVTLPAGSYTFGVSNVTSTDTDNTTSRILMYYNDSYVDAVDFNRGVEQTKYPININTTVNKLMFCAGHSYNDSAGDTFSYNGFYIKANSVLNSRITTLETNTTSMQSDIDTINTTLENKADQSFVTLKGIDVDFNVEARTKISHLYADLPILQTGTGDPSPSNIRNFITNTGASVELNNETISVTFTDGQNVYGGRYDFVKGKLYADIQIVEAQTLTTGWITETRNGYAGVARHVESIKPETQNRRFACSHLKNVGVTSAAVTDNSIENSTTAWYNLFLTSTENFSTREEFLEWATIQKNANTPVLLAFPLDNPIVYDYQAEELYTIAGSNNFTSSLYITLQYPYQINVKNIDSVSQNPMNLLSYMNGKRYIHHIGVYQSNDIIIPCQSIADVERAKRLGFTCMEINVRKTLDDKYVCLHGESGKFGPFFTDTEGVSVADTYVNTMTLAEIKIGIRYVSKYAKYRTAPFTLEEILYACKQNNIIPLVEYQDTYEGEIDILNSIMGLNNYILSVYNHNRDDITNAPLTSWLDINDPNNLVDKCNQSGGAYIAGINTESSAYSGFDLDDWKELSTAVHNSGYWISTSYGTEATQQLLIKAGFDTIVTTRSINDIENGNICNLIGDMDYSDFDTDGTVSAGVLSLGIGDNIAPDSGVTFPTVFLGGGVLKIKFNGQITINIGGFEYTLSSDGVEEMMVSSFFEESQPTFSITAVTATDVYSISYKASKM